MNREQIEQASREAAKIKQLAEEGATRTANAIDDNNQNLDTEQQLCEFNTIKDQATEIEKMAKDLLELSHGIDDLTKNDRERIIRIDDSIESAKQEMIEGLKYLAKAEPEKKKCNIC